MKFNKHFRGGFALLQMILVVAIIGILCAMALPAKAQYAPNFYQSDTNGFPLTLTNTQTATITGKKVTIRQGSGIAAFVTIVSTNTTATSETFGFDLTYNGTNGTTTHPLTWTVPGNVVGTNTYWTNWPATQVNNARTIAATFATNNAAGALPGSNAITATFTWSYSNQ